MNNSGRALEAYFARILPLIEILSLIRSCNVLNCCVYLNLPFRYVLMVSDKNLPSYTGLGRTSSATTADTSGNEDVCGGWVYVYQERERFVLCRSRMPISWVLKLDPDLNALWISLRSIFRNREGTRRLCSVAPRTISEK